MAPSRAMEVEDNSCCHVHFVRYMMYIFTVCTLLAGIALGLLAAYSYFLKAELLSLLHSDYYHHIIYGMAVCACVILFSSCFCCGAASSRCAAAIYVCLIMVVLVLESLVGYTVVMETGQLKRHIVTNFQNDVFNEYGFDNDTTRAIDIVQIEHKCCGARGFDDYVKDSTEEDVSSQPQSNEQFEDGDKPKVQYVPDSCCISVTKGCGINDHPSNIYYAGCEDSLLTDARKHFFILCGVLVVATCIQTLLFIFACVTCMKGPRHTHQLLTKQRADQDMSLFDY